MFHGKVSWLQCEEGAATERRAVDQELSEGLTAGGGHEDPGGGGRAPEACPAPAAGLGGALSMRTTNHGSAFQVSLSWEVSRKDPGEK